MITSARVIAAVCLILPIAAMLWVGSYTRMSPAFIGIPFFYWYQMAWVPVTALLTGVAYVLIRRDERSRAAAVRAVTGGEGQEAAK